MNFLGQAIAIIILTVLLISVGIASPESDDLDELICLDMQVSAVLTDMEAYLGWMFDYKEEMAKAAEKAIQDLKNIRSRLVALEVSKEDMGGVRDELVALIDGYIDIYTDIDQKDIEGIEQVFNGFALKNAAYAKDLKAAFEKYAVIKSLPLPLDHDAEREIENLISSPEDLSQYHSAVDLMKNDKPAEAYYLFKKLEGK